MKTKLTKLAYTVRPYVPGIAISAVAVGLYLLALKAQNENIDKLNTTIQKAIEDGAEVGEFKDVWLVIKK